MDNQWLKYPSKINGVASMEQEKSGVIKRILKDHFDGFGKMHSGVFPASYQMKMGWRLLEESSRPSLSRKDGCLNAHEVEKLEFKVTDNDFQLPCMRKKGWKGHRSVVSMPME